MLYGAVLDVLAQEGPLHRREVLDRVGAILSHEFTDYEKAVFRDRDDKPRWENALGWATTDMVAASWMTKENGLWAITGEGRAARANLPVDAELEFEATRAYHEKRIADGHVSTERHYAAAVTAAMDAVEPGMWTAYGDLASVASTNAQTVATFVREG